MPFAKLAFDDLPLDKTGPLGNAWGLFGPDDECGMLNLLTLERTRRVSTDWPFDRIATPAVGRAAFVQAILTHAPEAVNDESLQFNPHSSSQWDGLRHYGYQEQALYFKGRTLDDLLTTKGNGIHAWVEKGGIVGGGVLLDYAAWGAEANDAPIQPFTSQSIPVSVLEQIATTQGTEMRTGGILRCSVAGDMPSFEAWPCQDTRFWLHEWLLAGWGLPIGEMFNPEQLSEECRNRSASAVPGGIASPPNGVAIF
ncbi:hypothetical protein BO70DRAFT_390430 [Aspergillus heteromorphus CBS 117.55]|uniref:Uncharacterized protein n=1 Tax=Aspergillus heteromorphus CBS 117.55 TaxID=1448321 RepID=A0A317V2S1_9EURO|nr:uncharacterized protein BO70DRAFT_390430 [Aspergillus heteromorphus CBS 117.55]PWY67939.1 hypothetical protein BO70DRAFT_390430 [Aspergillus heteromorphus CBS 117.55]